VLLSKRDAADQQVNYTYDVAGRVLTRTWARGVVTTYGYTAGQITSVEYTNDPTITPAVNIAYDRLGRINNQSNDRSTTDYDYDPATLRLIREETTIDPDGAAGLLPSLTRSIDRSRDNLQRPTGFVLGNEHAVGYGYDVSGRLSTISAQGLPNLPGKTHAFEYLYAPGSSLIASVTGPVHEVDNTYEANRNVLSEKRNSRTVGTPGELSVIGYTVNEIGQRGQRNLSGLIRSEFYGGQAEDLYPTGWTYDALGQVTSEDKPSTASDRGYTYDQIGNRLTSTADTVTTTYSTNALNQYQEISVPSVQSVVPIHDQDGNMTTGLLNGSGNGQFEYDGANQLIRTQSTATSDPTKYAYDAFGRRIAKVTYPNGSAVAAAATVFLYDGWNLIAEYNLDSGAWALDRTYSWGLDLSGSTQGAGGVGGLLSVTMHEAQATAPFYPIYDGNGNIEAYIDSNGAPAAIYQYDAFGNVLSGAGRGDALEQANFSHRFSTKYHDAETGLLYYGLRYYHALLGRWINRDPIEERGGMNLYGFVGNGTPIRFDYMGLSDGSFFFYNVDGLPDTGPHFYNDLDMFSLWLTPLGFDRTGSEIPDSMRGGPKIGPLVNRLHMEMFGETIYIILTKNWLKLPGPAESIARIGSKLLPGEEATYDPFEIHRMSPAFGFKSGKSSWVSGYYAEGEIIGPVKVRRISLLEAGDDYPEPVLCGLRVSGSIRVTASDKSDFNPGGTFGAGIFWFKDQWLKDDWFIALRDHTPYGYDFWIYARETYQFDIRLEE
jgi:RHS repeat-associated protein